MNVQQEVRQTEKRTGLGALLERIGEASIEGERQRLAKMTNAQRSRDSMARKFVSGIFTFISVLITLGLLIGSFVDYPPLRIPLLIIVVLVVWLCFRKGKR